MFFKEKEGEDEEDYMSDKFVLPTCDIRPTLIHQRSTKRQLIIEDKQKDGIKKQKELKARLSNCNTNEVLQEALQKPLQTDNKGFQMLTKLGYIPGQALGKPCVELYKLGHSSKIEPIPITLKTDRRGLGHEAAANKVKSKCLELRHKHSEANEFRSGTNIEEFRKRVTQKVDERFTLIALRNCQAICKNLDRNSEIDKEEMRWFWGECDEESSEVIDYDTSEDINEEYTNGEKLWLLTGYLRATHNFCYWCGIHFNNQNDLLKNCPGPNKDDH